jgi:TRAP-type C4-dicarboxylate transport system permease large subunit
MDRCSYDDDGDDGTRFSAGRHARLVVSAMSKIELHRVYIGTSILMIAIILTTIMICIWPEIALWLPSTMK